MVITAQALQQRVKISELPSLYNTGGLQGRAGFACCLKIDLFRSDAKEHSRESATMAFKLPCFTFLQSYAKTS